MKKNKLYNLFFPKTRLGNISGALILFFFISGMMLDLLVKLGERGGEGFFSNLRLAFSGLIAAICAILSLILGLIAVVKYKERSILVFIAIVTGFLVSLFVMGEILYPH